MIAAGMILSAWTTASAQEAITQPLPRSEIQPHKGLIEADFLIGYNTELDITIYGLGGQFMFGFSENIAINAKATGLWGDNFSVFTLGGAIAFEVLPPQNQIALAVFGGGGISFVSVDVGGTNVNDTDGYIETGLQADIIAGKFRFIPFTGLTVVFNGDSSVIFGIGAKGQYELSPGLHLNAAIIGQFDDISDSVLFLGGLLIELK
jgi:hypothetical protein